MSPLPADGFPEAAVRHRARSGPAAAFPAVDSYGKALFGGTPPTHSHTSKPVEERTSTLSSSTRWCR